MNVLAANHAMVWSARCPPSASTRSELRGRARGELLCLRADGGGGGARRWGDGFRLSPE